VQAERWGGYKGLEREIPKLIRENWKEREELPEAPQGIIHILGFGIKRCSMLLKLKKMVV